MSDKKQETRDDIVREMRRLGELDEESTDKIPRSLMGLGLRTYADRLEAAAKREREAATEKSSAVGDAPSPAITLDEAIAHAEDVADRYDTCCGRQHRQLADWLKELRDMKSQHIGDSAAMREALETIHDKVNGLGEECGVDPVEIRDLARAALAKPPRNCNVGTAEEQLDRYGVYCQNRCTSCDNRHYCHICGERYRMKCMMEWAQMPYEEGGAQ